MGVPPRGRRDQGGRERPELLQNVGAVRLHPGRDSRPQVGVCRGIRGRQDEVNACMAHTHTVVVVSVRLSFFCFCFFYYLFLPTFSRRRGPVYLHANEAPETSVLGFQREFLCGPKSVQLRFNQG